jgi:hypothetical protein
MQSLSGETSALIFVLYGILLVGGRTSCSTVLCSVHTYAERASYVIVRVSTGFFCHVTSLAVYGVLCAVGNRLKSGAAARRVAVLDHMAAG